MGRPQKGNTERAEEIAGELESILETLKNDYQNDTIKAEIQFLINRVRAIKSKLPKIQKLSMAIGRQFVKINDRGDLEIIAFDEGYRQIMGYPQTTKGETTLEYIDKYYTGLWAEFLKWRSDRENPGARTTPAQGPDTIRD